MGRSAILLIGTEKTGTTTLQHFLAANREALARRGFVYPAFCGALNHTGLAAYALDPAKRDPIREPFGALPRRTSRRCGRGCAQRRRRSSDGGATAIFCSEHCHSRLKTAAEVEALRDFLGGFFDEVRIGVYLRRQDQVALSLYSTRLKSGEVERQILPRDQRRRPLLQLRPLAGALGGGLSGATRCRCGSSTGRTLVGGSVVDDFLATWELGPIGRLRAGGRPERVDPPGGAGVPAAVNPGSSRSADCRSRRCAVRSRRGWR